LWFARAGSGPGVLFIQGVGIIGQGWRPQIDDLSGNYTTVIFDNRGIGRSPRGRSPLSIASMADDALSVARAAGLDTFHVVGHSLGGVIAQELALRETSRIRSLTLMCTVARGREALGLHPRMLWLGARTKIGSRAMRRRAFLDIVMPPDAIRASDAERLAADLAELFGHDLADTPSIVGAQLRALASYDATPRLAALSRIPTLVMSAHYDPIARPSSGRRLAAAIPGAQLEVWNDASHGLPIQWASRVNARVARHLAAAPPGSC